jgi:hypothetical protein
MEELTEDQVIEAVHQVMVTCDLKMADYEAVSLRSALAECGYRGEQAQQVINHVAAGGFDYCLDPSIPMTGHHDAQGEKPSYEVCYWGPDQLKSRLQCLSNVPRRLNRG